MSINIKDLIKALEAGSYNASPAILRNGCMMAVSDDGKPLTEEDLDELWIGAVGNCNRWATESPCNNAKCLNHKKCECGVSKTGGIHSDWCPVK